MWGTFEKCKLQLKETLNRNRFVNGLSGDALREQAQDIIEKYKSISVSRAKSEAIAFILKNAGIDILPEDLFVTQLNHPGIMSAFLDQMTAEAKRIADTAVSEE